MTVGTNGNDTLTGTAGNDLLQGLAGHDVLIGGAGTDRTEGGIGNDTHEVERSTDIAFENAGEGTDTVMSSASYVLGANIERLILTGATAINGTGNGLNNFIAGNDAGNTLDGGGGIDTMEGGGGNDIYIADHGADKAIEDDPAGGTDLVRSSASFTLGANVENLTLTGTAAVNGTGNGLANFITGNQAANILNGGVGADRMRGGDGNDTYVVDHAGDRAEETSAAGGTDTVLSSIGFTLGSYVERLTLTGTDAINGTGNALNNVLRGNAAANILNGGMGADQLIGGGGDDVYIVDNSLDKVAETSAAGGTDRIQSSVSFVLGINVENLTLIGSGAINGTGNALDNVLIGNAAANILNGGAGADSMRGGAGNDVYTVDDAGDTALETSAAHGTDTVRSSISFILGANLETLILTGTAAIDGTGNGLVNILTGNLAANVLNGGGGADSLRGGDGNDTYVVDHADDTVIETSASHGTDLVRSAVDFLLGAHLENLTLTGAAAIDGTGNGLDNIIIGNNAANILNGGAGADSMRGAGGNDTYFVDDEDDGVIEDSAGGGTDLVRSSVSLVLGAHVENLILTGVNTIDGTGNALANQITGNSAANRLDGGAGADVMTGGNGDDIYVVDHENDQAVETSGVGGTDLVQSSVEFTLGTNLENLTLAGASAIDGTGNSLANLLIGNGAANRLDGGLGADTMQGGLGDDIYVVDDAGDQVVETSGAGGVDLVQSSVSFTLGANVENLMLTGGGGVAATGNGLANVITGNSSGNVIDGGAGADSLRGAGGDDIYFVDDAGDEVVEDSAIGGTDTVHSSVSFTLGGNIENLVLTGAAAIDGTGNGLANVLIGNDAANVLNGNGGADTMTGGLGNDIYFVDDAGDQVNEAAASGTDWVHAALSWTLGANLENLTLTGVSAINGTGNNIANQINGNAAANRLDGGGSGDTMRGGGGDDDYIVDDQTDQVIETAGDGIDTVYSAVQHALWANVENLVLTGTAAGGFGNALANHIIGNAEANTLDGGAGIDLLEGGDGDDIYIVDQVGDVVVEASAAGGTDYVKSIVDFTIGENIEYLYLNGTAAVDGTGNSTANIISGNSGANRIEGGGGDDWLSGLEDDDFIDGGTGQDMLLGGAGQDSFAFTAALTAANIDAIQDFSVSEDTILLAGGFGEAFAALATGGLWEGSLLIGSAATNAYHRIIYNSATGALLYDSDGIGGAAAVQFASLGPGLTLTASDFAVTGPDNFVSQIVSGDMGSVAENSPISTIVYQTLINDPDGDKVTYRIFGADAADFTIDQNGAVRFIAPPDFEVKNDYAFIVEILDSAGMGAVKMITVTVTDVAETADPYLVNETAAANDNRFNAQPLDRNLFTVADSPNVPDDSLPSAIISGNVSTPGDKDFFSITLNAGEKLILDIDGTDTLDAWVTVYDQNGNIVTFNDDPGGPFDPGSTPHPGVGHNMDSFIAVRVPSDGIYYISVESFFDETGPSSDGEYVLNVSIAPPATPEELIEENIQALISGDSWSTTDLTYGFTNSGDDYGPGEGVDEIAAGMSPLNGQQRNAVRTILAQYSNLSDLDFTEQTVNPGGADLRYALSNAPETAYAFYPGSGDGGDSWYNTTEYTGPAVGNYEWLTFIHETGHALGLKHGHESPALTPDRDSLEFSVMTYRSYIGDPVDDDSGYANETFGFPQTLMMYDIAALQRVYGADFSYNSGDTTYSWDPNSGAFSINGVTQWAPGENRVFMTLWDGNGEDTYDLSNYLSAVTIDLRPGFWSYTSGVQLANLGNGHHARGNVFNALLHDNDPRSLIENAIGGSGADTFVVNQAVNHLTGNAGNDTFRWLSVDDSLPGFADVLMDFVRGADKIDLSEIDARSDTPGNGTFEFIGTAAFSEPPFGWGQVRYDVVGSEVHVFADVNADGIADFQLIMNNLTALDSTDFML